jgi:hypothetical protein
MPIRTNEFQRLIAVIQSNLDPGSTVTESAMLTGRPAGWSSTVPGQSSTWSSTAASLR